MVDSIARNQGNVVMAASLGRVLNPQGFQNLGSNEMKKVAGFSTNTATLLFQPLTNVVDAQNALLEQRIFSRFDNETERVDARTVSSQFRTRELNENPALRRSPQDVLEDLRARFGVSSEGPRTRFAPASDRPTLNEVFSGSATGFSPDVALTQVLNSRVAVSGGSTLTGADLSLGTSPSVPDKVLVRLDGSVRTGEDETLGSSDGSLSLNGTALNSGQVYELSLAEFQALEYTAGSATSMDYLSVLGVNSATNERGEIVTTSIAINGTGVERFIRDDLERYEFIAETEANVTIPRVSVDFTGTFVNGDALSDIDAGLIEVTVNQFGDLDNIGTNLLLQSTGNKLDVTFGSSPPVDGVVVSVKALDPAVDVSDIRVTFS